MAAVFLALLAITASAAVETPRNYAIVIGYNQSDDPKTPALRYADDDAIQYAHLLEEFGVKTFLLVDPDEATARLYPNLQLAGAPTRNELHRIIEETNIQIRTHSPGESQLFFVYAGHGDVKNGEGYINFGDGPFRRNDLYDAVLSRTLATHQHVVIDACKSYFMVFERGNDSEEISRTPFTDNFDEPQTLMHWPHAGFILSTSSGTNSHEWEGFQSGVFSHEVRSALRGAADANLDGNISYNELAAFVWNANAGIANEKYRPNFLIVPPVSDNILVSLNPQTQEHYVEIQAKPGEHYYVETVQGVRLLDSRSAATRQRWLLPKQRLFIRNDARSEEFDIPDTHARVVALNHLTAKSSTVQSRGAAHEAFRQLFAVPFAASNLENRHYTKLVWSRLGPNRPAEQIAGGTLKPWLWGGVAFTGASVGAAVTFRLLANHFFSQHEQASLADRPSLREKTKRYDTTAWLFFGTAAVSGATTLLGALISQVWDSHPSSSISSP